MSISPAVVRRVMRELKGLEKNPLEGIRVQTSEEDMLDVTGLIEGPEGTPYAGGYFKVKFRFTNEFPAVPPKCWFATKIFHPNVGPTGEICVNTLKKDWKPEYGIGHILVTVKCLLIYPNPESALDEEAGRLLLEEYARYCERAKLITSVHATPRVKPVEFNIPAAVDESSSSSAKDGGSCSASGLVASTSKVDGPTTTTTTVVPSTSPLRPLISITSPKSTTTMPLVVPVIITRKSASPLPAVSLKNTLIEKEGAVQQQQHKARHPSPSPLGTADSNVGRPGMGGSVGGKGNMAQSAGGVGGGGGGITGTKAMKRAATGPAPTNAEKRKKALKRL